VVIAVPTGPTHTHSAYIYTQGLHIPTGPIHTHRAYTYPQGLYITTEPYIDWGAAVIAFLSITDIHITLAQISTPDCMISCLASYLTTNNRAESQTADPDSILANVLFSDAAVWQMVVY